MTDLPKVSTIIRLHDPKGLQLLKRAINSLHSQIEVSVQPIVVLQRFSDIDYKLVREALEENWFFDEHQPPEIINFQDDGNDDVRSELINAGIKRHTELANRFMAFLDYDDYLYSHAYKTLIRPLLHNQAAFAFASVEVTKVIALSDYEFIYSMEKPFEGKNKLDLLRENFCPIHSYVIDTAKIPTEELFFRTDFTRLEDYEFLLRVAGRNPCDFSNLRTKIGCYVFRNDSTNTTPNFAAESEGSDRVQEWAQAQKKLNTAKSGIEVKLFASDF